jgi:hypothetical protein
MLPFQGVNGFGFCLYPKALPLGLDMLRLQRIATHPPTYKKNLPFGRFFLLS